MLLQYHFGFGCEYRKALQTSKNGCFRTHGNDIETRHSGIIVVEYKRGVRRN